MKGRQVWQRNRSKRRHRADLRRVAKAATVQAAAMGDPAAGTAVRAVKAGPVEVAREGPADPEGPESFESIRLG